MHFFSGVFFGAVALYWIVKSVRAARGTRNLPRCDGAAPAQDSRCPAISVLFAARDEASALPRSLPMLLAQDYPPYEVIAADDRSRDATGRILDDFAKENPRLHTVPVRELPAGWLGKTHALHQAYLRSSSEWLLFTDADVHFSRDALRRSVALAEERGWDHLTLLGTMDLIGFWEKTAIIYFGLAFSLWFEPWDVSRPGSRAFMGVGAFQLIRRSVYEAVGGHRRLAREVIDDMKLGKLVKQAGFRSGCALAGECLHIRWQEGISNLVRGTSKNFFAGANFSIALSLAQILGILCISVLPWVGLLAGAGWPRALAGVCTATALAVHAGAAYYGGVSPLYCVTQPLGALILCYMMARSAVVTLWRGGVVWRDTFYPLEELRRGLV